MLRLMTVISSFLLNEPRPSPAKADSITTASLLEHGKTCKPSAFAPSQLNCTFVLWNNFRIVIAGVGEKGAQVAFEESSIAGHWYAAFGTGHGCIMVKPGELLKSTPQFQVAFISPISARVFSSWEMCAADREKDPK